MKGGLIAIISHPRRLVDGLVVLRGQPGDDRRRDLRGHPAPSRGSSPLGLFALSILLFSQAATVVTLRAGRPRARPAACRCSSAPTRRSTATSSCRPTAPCWPPSSFDQTGTTRIGKYLLNHSFMLPGLVATAVVAMVSALAPGPVGPSEPRSCRRRQPCSRAITVRFSSPSSACWSRQSPRPPTSRCRVEQDLLGEKQIPADAYYGVQTARALENFQISGIPISHYPEFIEALRHRQARRRAGEQRRRRPPEGQAGADRARLQGGHRRASTATSSRSTVPGRRRHLDQHERQRGARQRRAGARGAPEGRLPVPRPARPPQHVAVDQRLLSRRRSRSRSCSATTS